MPVLWIWNETPALAIDETIDVFYNARDWLGIKTNYKAMLNCVQQKRLKESVKETRNVRFEGFAPISDKVVPQSYEGEIVLTNENYGLPPHEAGPQVPAAKRRSFRKRLKKHFKKLFCYCVRPSTPSSTFS